MGEQSATRLKGDDHQHLYSWFELLQLLMQGSLYAYGYVEHPQAGAADDITLHPLRSGTPAKYTQVKFHVDQRAQYSSSSLVETSKENARSLLHKLFDSWNQLRKEGEQDIEIWLVSNWACDVGLGKFIHDSYVLTEDFFSGGLKSAAAQVRKHWARELGVNESTLNLFCRSLRLRLGFAGLNELINKQIGTLRRFKFAIMRFHSLALRSRSAVASPI